jgi:hypothetical protein
MYMPIKTEPRAIEILRVSLYKICNEQLRAIKRTNFYNFSFSGSVDESVVDLSVDDSVVDPSVDDSVVDPNITFF